MSEKCVKIGVAEDIPSGLLRELSSTCFEHGFGVHYFRPSAAANVPEVFSNVDWQELREQKEWLTYFVHESASGLLELLDHFQDQACEAGIPEETVFGPPTPHVCMLPDGWCNRLTKLAEQEGWLVCRRGDGCFEIQKLDEPDEGVREFTGDRDALAFVTEKALSGSALHMLALFLDGRKDAGDDVWVPFAMAEAVSGK